MKKIMFSILFLFLMASFAQGGKIRTLRLSKSRIGTIRLSSNHATLVEVPTKSFKLVVGAPEYLEIAYQPTSFIIKPKIEGVKTNLFVLTSVGRFNLHLESAPPASSDEVVTLEFRSRTKRSTK